MIENENFRKKVTRCPAGESRAFTQEATEQLPVAEGPTNDENCQSALETERELREGWGDFSRPILF
jgi:hypothetical protein